MKILRVGCLASLFLNPGILSSAIALVPLNN
jgi:hypothetical protein